VEWEESILGIGTEDVCITSKTSSIEATVKTTRPPPLVIGDRSSPTASDENVMSPKASLPKHNSDGENNNAKFSEDHLRLIFELRNDMAD